MATALAVPPRNASPAVWARANEALQTQVANLKAAGKAANDRVKELVSDHQVQLRALSKELPTVGLYGGGAALIGAYLGYMMHEKAIEYFGADSKVGLLITASTGVAVLLLTPKIVKVSAKKLKNTVPVAAAAYGAGIGILGAGLFGAWQSWPSEEVNA